MFQNGQGADSGATCWTLNPDCPVYKSCVLGWITKILRPLTYLFKNKDADSNTGYLAKLLEDKLTLDKSFKDSAWLIDGPYKCMFTINPLELRVDVFKILFILNIVFPPKVCNIVSCLFEQGYNKEYYSTVCSAYFSWMPPMDPTLCW